MTIEAADHRSRCDFSPLSLFHFHSFSDNSRFGGIAADSSGDVYIAGTTTSSTLPVIGGPCLPQMLCMELRTYSSPR